MAEKVEIRMAFRADGSVELSTHGLKGEECVDETKELERAVGRVVRRAKTSEASATRQGVTASIRRFR